MRTIYEPAGRAKEYAELAINIYEGCPHGCTYCFNQFVPWYNAATFFNAAPREGLLDALEPVAKRLAGDPREILLCFTCDPYPRGMDDTSTREVLRTLERHKLRVSILTKSGLQSTRDFDILRRNGWSYGATIGIHTEDRRKWWEPHAAPFSERLDALIRAHKEGIRTWVSVEPVVDINEALECMQWCSAYVDFWKIGKLNHADAYRSAPIGWVAPDWGGLLFRAQKFLAGRPHYIKRDLAQYATTLHQQEKR